MPGEFNYGERFVYEIKVLLANSPRMLRESLKELIQRQDDMEVVGEVLDPLEVLLSVNEYDADVVVVSLPETLEDPGICSHLLVEYPRLVILALSAGCEEAVLYSQCIRREALSGTSSDEILSAIRKRV